MTSYILTSENICLIIWFGLPYAKTLRFDNDTPALNAYRHCAAHPSAWDEREQLCGTVCYGHQIFQNKILNFWKLLDIQRGVLYGNHFQYR